MIPIPIKLKCFLVVLKRNPVIKVLIIPAKKLIKNAVVPLVIPTNNDFITAIIKDIPKPICAEANIVAILDNPSLDPGGRNGKTGIKSSNIESIIETVHSRDIDVIFIVLDLIL